MWRKLALFIGLAFSIAFPPPIFPQSASALMSKPPRIDPKALMTKANSGNPQAQFELGVAYEYGLGVDKS